MTKTRFIIEIEPGVYHGREAQGRITREDSYTGTTEAWPDGTVHTSTAELHGGEILEVLQFLSEFCEENWGDGKSG